VKLIDAYCHLPTLYAATVRLGCGHVADTGVHHAAHG